MGFDWSNDSPRRVPDSERRTNGWLALSFMAILLTAFTGFNLGATGPESRRPAAYGLTSTVLYALLRLCLLPLVSVYIPDYCKVRAWRDQGSFYHRAIVVTQAEWDERIQRRTVAITELCVYLMGACVTGMALGMSAIDKRTDLNSAQKTDADLAIFFSMLLTIIAIPLLAFGYRFTLPDCLKVGKFINALSVTETAAIRSSSGAEKGSPGESRLNFLGLPLPDKFSAPRDQQEISILEQIAKSHGWAYQDVEADGNCFFHAVIAALTAQGRTDIIANHDHIELRLSIMQYLRAHQDDFPEFLAAHPEGLDAYITIMSQNACWVDGTVVQITAKALNIDIQIFTGANGKSSVVKANDSAASAATTITLGNIAQRHYVCFLSSAASSVSGPLGARQSNRSRPPDQILPWV